MGGEPAGRIRNRDRFGTVSQVVGRRELGARVTDYEYMGGICTTRPEAVAWGPNRLDVFLLGTDHALWHKWWDGASWGPADRLGIYGRHLPAAPKAVAWGPNRLDVFVLGTDLAVYHKWWDGANWGPSVTDYEYQGGICTTPPEVVAWGPNRLDVFVLGTDHALYHKWWDGANWGPSLTGWEYLGGTCASAPKAVAWGPNRLDIFVLGMDLALYHKWWDGANWGPRRPIGNTWAASVRASRRWWRGAPIASTCSCWALTWQFITNGGTARTGARPSPVTSTWAASAPVHPA